MKKPILLLMLMTAIFLLSCCSTLKVTEIDPWLTAKAGGAKPSIDISGEWQDAINNTNTFISWGSGTLTQTGAKVTGSIGQNGIKGIVAEKTVYLIIYDSYGIKYTAKLELVNDNELFGGYYSSRDKNQTKPLPMNLKRN
jgi:hypothetical protein